MIKQELLLKSEQVQQSKRTRADKKLVTALRVILYSAAAVYWLHETFAGRARGPR